MGDQFYRSGRSSGKQHQTKKDPIQRRRLINEVNNKSKDDDLVIEENTVYEIDRECYERLNRQKRR